MILSPGLFAKTRPSDEEVAQYLEVLHLAESLPKPKGARSRRRRNRMAREMFNSYWNNKPK